MISTTPTPLADAVRSISARTPIGSALRSAEWAEVPRALRARAQFSAGIESARVLQAIQDRMSGLLKLESEQLAGGDTATFDRSSFIDAVGKIAREEGLTPADPELRGGLQDITSVPRLGLIYDMQNANATGFSKFKGDQTEGALLLYPAQELTDSSARVPRELSAWQSRFAEAAQSAGDDEALAAMRDTGRMVALKTSALWEILSEFGNPWPPFDWGSTRMLSDVDRDDAINLGLMTHQTQLLPRDETFNANLEASAQGLDARYVSALEKFFGNQIEVSGDTVKWRAA